MKFFFLPLIFQTILFNTSFSQASLPNGNRTFSKVKYYIASRDEQTDKPILTLKDSANTELKVTIEGKFLRLSGAFFSLQTAIHIITEWKEMPSKNGIKSYKIMSTDGNNYQSWILATDNYDNFLSLVWIRPKEQMTITFQN